MTRSDERRKKKRGQIFDLLAKMCVAKHEVTCIVPWVLRLIVFELVAIEAISRQTYMICVLKRHDCESPRAK